ncbi:SelB C-terminal domain-containing protein [Georgenia alba]|uniref:SelB C-terminal domain-containing protein n=1 Tax=Georgenia alba TaxID=2233858 RepID=A0ABW2QAT7_9MICO
MHVVATAGHVDHGKSTLVRALTGTDPDRLPEEHRRGLTIELGFCWTRTADGEEVAFVDVPGHERFLPTALAGMGPVPVVLLVVASDESWMPQTAEHVAALDALGVRHGVVAVTRSDLADPGPAGERAHAELRTTSLADAPVVAVSSRTGSGLVELRRALERVLADVPAPDPDAEVRLWVDRRFTVRGVGTVVTGTLPAGRLAPGDRLEVAGAPGVVVRVRGLQSLGRDVPEARGVARVALNLVGDVEAVARGSALVAPDAWPAPEVLDVRLRGVLGPAVPPDRPVLHVGSTAVAVHHRPLGEDAGGTRLARLSLDRRLPLRIGDRALLRDPGDRALWGVHVLDPMPPPLGRRGAAARRAAQLREVDGPDAAGELRRREVADLGLLRRIGAPVGPGTVPGAVVAGGVAVSGERAARAADAALRLVREHDAADPLEPGLPVPALADRLGLPEAAVPHVLAPPLRVDEGRVRLEATSALPEEVERAVASLGLRDFSAPTADRLREAGLDERALAAAARAGRLLRPAPGIVLPPDAADRAVRVLAGLPQPFTTSEARTALATTRRVVLPLLDHLDRAGMTRRLPDDRREMVAHRRDGA